MLDQIAENIYFILSRSFDSNIIYIKSGDREVLVDAGTGLYTSNLDKDLQTKGGSIQSITDIVLTHCHIDHLGGVIPLLEAGSPKIHLHGAEAVRINNGDMSLTLGDTFGADLPPFKVDELLNEGDVIDFGDVKLKVYHTPGHSSGSITMEIMDTGILITGDTLFPGGSFGRTDFPDGDSQKLVASLRRLSEMDFQIGLPGHMNAMKFNARHSAMKSYEMAKGWFRT
ncbi:MAG: MBL fold metallo-hydrolase [Candidatus Thorarchaeota archaeon]|jgi:glyoxylase-like metal-dependent hydrolase (beta-lactamase superfamily II)